MSNFSRILLKNRNAFTHFSRKCQTKPNPKKISIQDGPGLDYFVKESSKYSNEVENLELRSSTPHYLAPYLSDQSIIDENSSRKVLYETFGCQMNVNDMEVVRSIMKSSGYGVAKNRNEASIVLIMTCSIREGAEQKIWQRLNSYRSLKRRRKKNDQLLVGVLGCMAERLKHKMLETEKTIDFIAGPDAYRDLPKLVATASSGQQTANVLLSLDETYADITPVRLDSNSVTAFVSIMRGCDNMCTYCIVPFTRGRERSRDIDSIIDEIRQLSDQGVKQVTLLGQNVNSYRDLSTSNYYGNDTKYGDTRVEGFKTVYKPKMGGRTFADLLDKTSLVDPEMRIRFTSPHPKDFPNEVIQVIADRPNICKQIHLPAQSGNDQMLEAMGRGYTRDTYLKLVQRIRQTIPDISLTSDFIAGFCGETDQAHKDTIDLIREVKYEFCFAFPYSLREKTRAHRRLTDDVPIEVKNRRTRDLLDAFRVEALKLHKTKIGQKQLLLVDGLSKRSTSALSTRNDAGTKVIVENGNLASDFDHSIAEMKFGDYVVGEILDCSSQVLIGRPLYRTTLKKFNEI